MSVLFCKQKSNLSYVDSNLDYIGHFSRRDLNIDAATCMITNFAYSINDLNRTFRDVVYYLQGQLSEGGSLMKSFSFIGVVKLCGELCGTFRCTFK